MESGRGDIPLWGAKMWVDTIDLKDRRNFAKGEDGFYLIPAGKHEVGLGWAASYLSSFGFITLEMKAGHCYLAYAKSARHTVDFWIVDAATGQLVDEIHTASIANRPPIN